MKKQQSNTGREYWYGRPTSLKDTEAYRNSENSERIDSNHPKRNIPKEPRGFPSMVSNSAIAGIPLYRLHQGSKM
jgi:hypothetical protein